MIPFWGYLTEDEKDRCVLLLRKQAKCDMFNAMLKRKEEYLKIFLTDEEYLELDFLCQKGWTHVV